MRASYARFGRWLFRHRIAVLIAWPLALLLALPFAQRAPALLEAGSGQLPGTDSARVEEILARDFDHPFTHSLAVTLASSRERIDSPEFTAALNTFAERMRAHPAVARVIVPSDELVPQFRGADGRTIAVLVGLRAAHFDEAEDLVPSVRAAVHAAWPAGQFPAWDVRVTGRSAINHDLGVFNARDSQAAELRALPLSLLVLVVVFGSLVAAALPLELLVDASLCIQQPIPSNSALLQQALGPEAAGGATMDVHSSCLGFAIALQVVNGLFAAGAHRRAVIACAETHLRGVNWNDPESAHLMGDGAAAVVLETCKPQNEFTFRFETFGEGANLCQVQGGGHRLPPYDYVEAKRARYQFEMDGKGVHKFASTHLPPMVRRVLTEAGARIGDLHVVPHQASGPSIELLARRLGVNRERLHSSVQNHGNLVAAGIPFVLHAARAELPPGTRVMLIGTAAGYSQAAAIFTL